MKFFRIIGVTGLALSMLPQLSFASSNDCSANAQKVADAIAQSLSGKASVIAAQETEMQGEVTTYGSIVSYQLNGGPVDETLQLVFTYGPAGAVTPPCTLSDIETVHPIR